MKPCKLRVLPGEAETWAAEIWSGHRALVRQGYRLCQSTGFWRTKHGLVTARLVYRNETAGPLTVDSFVVTVKGVRIERPAA